MKSMRIDFLQVRFGAAEVIDIQSLREDKLMFLLTSLDRLINFEHYCSLTSPSHPVRLRDVGEKW